MASVPERKLDRERTGPALQPLTPTAVPTKEYPSASTTAAPSAEEIYHLIRETAYFKAEARHFAPGVEMQDWLEAEQEVRQRLQISGWRRTVSGGQKI